MSALLLLLLPTALAAGESVDVELVRPTFSDGPALGVDTPWIEQAGLLRAGTLLQYSRDPLVLYEYGDEAGTVISHRATAHLGVSADLGRGASARLVMPAATQWGSEVPGLASDGPGLGDLRAGLRFVPPVGGAFRAGLRVDLAVPTGTRDAWMGEATPRLHPGLLLGVRSGALETSLEAGIEARTALDTGVDFVIGTEAVGGLALRWHVWPERAAISGALLGRGVLSDLFAGGAENPAELLSGIQLWPASGLQVDLGIGKGLTDGYGTSELRLLGGLTWVRRPPPPAPPPLRLVDLEALEAIEDAAPPPPPPPVDEGWDEGELARVEENRIVIREPIQFERATDRIMPESLPVLAQVSQVLHDDASIGHIVVEGHASEEGSFTYNYELSILRARAVWEALVDNGVHPLRVSYRGMGEVVPVTAGEDEVSLASNRRVEFHILFRRTAEDPPVPSGTVRLPWNGEEIQSEAPAELPPSPPPQQDEVDPYDEPYQELP